MMSLLQLNYDELNAIASRFRDEGEDLAQQYSNLAQRLQALRQDWMGEASDSFYTEMQESLLPALKRSYQALFTAEEATRKITILIHQADEETAQRFKTDFGADFGASLFAQTGLSAADDFGVGIFDNVIPGGEFAPGESMPPVEDGGATGAEATGVGTLEEFPPSQEGADADEASAPLSEEPAATEEESAPAETAPAGGGGGSGGESSSAGNANSLGSGLGAQPGNQSSMVSGGERVMPENLSPGQSGSSEPQGNGGISSSSGEASGASSPGGTTATAGVIGAAALGIAGKIARDAAHPSDENA